MKVLGRCSEDSCLTHTKKAHIKTTVFTVQLHVPLMSYDHYSHAPFLPGEHFI